MKVITEKKLVLGDVFATEIKMKGREAMEVVEIPEGKEYIIVKTRGQVKTKRFSVSDSKFVYLLRNINQ